MPTIDFWFSVGSTYTYLTVQRLPEVARTTGVSFVWRPFSVRTLMQEMNNVPFVGKPEKERYMWRDLERRAGRYGIPIRLPVEYPLQEFDRANRVAIAAQQEGCCEDYVRSAYRLWYQQGVPAGSEQSVSACAEEAGRDPAQLMEAANSDAAEAAYSAATSEARKLGIFGSPSFVTPDGELFWGDDRLEDAVEHARGL